MVGETFADNTVYQHFRTLNEENSYTHAIYEVKYFTISAFKSELLTTVARVRNCIAVGLKTVVTPLPKMIVVVLEDDIINSIKRKDMVERIYDRVVRWLLFEVRKILDGHNDSLPKKARRKVTVIWVTPSMHMNYSDTYNRKKLTKVLQNVAKLIPNNHALSLRQIWDPDNFNLYLKEQRRLTAEGRALLWRAVDRTIWFADTLIHKANDKEIRSFQIFEPPKVTSTVQYRLGPPLRPSFRGRYGNRTWHRGAYSRNYNKPAFFARNAAPNGVKLPQPPGHSSDEEEGAQKAVAQEFSEEED